MGRAPCCENKAGLKKGAWTAEEDEKLVAFIHKNNGHGSWRTLPQLAGLQRCGKSCRLRWTNYLRPNIKRGNFTPEEEWTITQLHAVLGNKWSTIASRLPGRTDNEVKNHWNTHLKKQLSRLGIDPVTHRPASVSSLVTFNNVNVKDDNMVKYSRQKSSLDCKHRTHTTALPRVSVLDRSYVSHMAQWELARLEAEARQMSGKACASSTSSDGMKYTAGVAAASIAGKSQAYSCSRGQGQGQGQGQENEMLELILGELLQDAPIAGGSLPSLDTSNSSSSAGSQLMNEVDITSDLTSFISIMRSPSPSSPNCTAAHDALLPLIPASPLPAPSEATSHITYWANMLSLVGPVISSCPA